MTDLPALREAVAKMTPGPWECVATGFHGDELHIGPPDKPAVVRNIPRADAAGIVALRNAAPALLDELETLRQRVNEDNEVCLCGCPPDAHECYEEGGESCENETHTCLRVCRSVAAEFEASQKALSAERIEVAHLREAFVTMERAANQHETDLAAARAVLDGAYRLPRGTSPDNSIHLCVHGAAWLAWQAWAAANHFADIGNMVEPAREREDS